MMLTDEMKAMPQSVQPTPAAPPRKPPAKRTYQEDEINALLSQDIIGDFSELNSTHAPPGFQCTKSDTTSDNSSTTQNAKEYRVFHGQRGTCRQFIFI